MLWQEESDDEGKDVMKFKDKSEAVDFLKDSGLDDEDIGCLEFYEEDYDE